jgi:hypothetical protein
MISEKVVAEAGNSSGTTRGRGTIAVGSRYRATAIEDVTVDTSVFVNCKV